MLFKFLCTDILNDRKIIRQTRKTITVVDGKGKIKKFQLVETPPLKIKTKPRPGKVKRKLIRGKKSASKAEQNAAAMPKCFVHLQRLSKAEIAAKIAQIENVTGGQGGEGEILKCLPRK